MSKVLSCKVEDSVYDIIDSLDNSNSKILRDLITEYVKTLEKTNEKDSIPIVYERKKVYKYKDIIKRVDKAISVYNKDE